MLKAIVTGHSRGLGQAVAAEFMARGIAVMGVSRKSSSALAGNELLTEISLDLADAKAVIQWLQMPVLSSFASGADQLILINNAGLVTPVAPPTRQSLPEVARSVALNVTAPLLLTAGLVQTVPECNDFRVVQISSGAARTAYAGWSVYCATKAAMDHYSRAVQLDDVDGLKMVSLAPGVIDTDMQTQLRATPQANFPNLKRFVEMKNEGALTPPDVAGKALVDYTLSDAFGCVATADLRQL